MKNQQNRPIEDNVSSCVVQGVHNPFDDTCIVVPLRSFFFVVLHTAEVAVLVPREVKHAIPCPL